MGNIHIIVDNEAFCKFCYSNLLSEFLTNGSTQQDIIDYLAGICDSLPFPLSTVCSSALGGNVGQIIEDLVNNNLQPQEVCEKLKLCPVDESPVLSKLTAVTGTGSNC